MDGAAFSDETLSVRLDLICAENRHTTDPAAVIAELRRVAGQRMDVLLESVGLWVGYARSPSTARLCDAIEAAFPDCKPWVKRGRTATRAIPRRSARPHT